MLAARHASLFALGRRTQPRPSGERGSASGRLRVQLVPKPTNAKGFAVLPRRWVVERTFAWLGQYRRLTEHDVETHPRNSEDWTKVCISKLMLRRLAKLAPTKHTE
ncbi:transposase [Hymenobacter montanus]|uniref:transposase n=1 Tax=Hymenobacter montanus TaxID=2771359 RepID=UPI0037426B5E